MSRQRVLRWMWLGTVPYDAAWDAQRALATAKRDGELDDDVLLLLEHPPVFTMGRNGTSSHLRDGAEALRAAGADFVDVDRGGSVTFHGPGQLVAYPIVSLARVLPIPGHESHGDVLRYLRALEQALIETAGAYGVAAQRRPPHTGVWVGEEKLASIGVKVAGGVTTHGVALNVGTDLSWFDLVVACGIDGARTASLSSLGVTGLTPGEVAPVFADALARALDEQLFETDATLRSKILHMTSAAAA
ncbi:MAG TPA: lipoyl(octanoyl) transferase LipB [Candidatus Dormibacteraeota bacterium]|nr:lipoyl(octanoyl) transferase LipB [Candidatus Dormibacteraeota bacterium]